MLESIDRSIKIREVDPYNVLPVKTCPLTPDQVLEKSEVLPFSVQELLQYSYKLFPVPSQQILALNLISNPDDIIGEQKN